MCLKKFVNYTFSNREAFERLLVILNDEYGKYLPKGEIFIIHSYRDWGKKYQDKRNDLSYDELIELMRMFYSPFKVWSLVDFYDWGSFNLAVKQIGEEKDIFGEITIEVQ